MKTITTVLVSAGMAMASLCASAQDAMSTGKPMAKDGAMMSKKPTMQECKDHMAMPKTDEKKDASTKKMEKECGTMMKKDGAMAKPDAMSKPDSMGKGAASAPMK